MSLHVFFLSLLATTSHHHPASFPFFNYSALISFPLQYHSASFSTQTILAWYHLMPLSIPFTPTNISPLLHCLILLPSQCHMFICPHTPLLCIFFHLLSLFCVLTSLSPLPSHPPLFPFIALPHFLLFTLLYDCFLPFAIYFFLFPGSPCLSIYVLISLFSLTSTTLFFQFPPFTLIYMCFLSFITSSFPLLLSFRMWCDSHSMLCVCCPNYVLHEKLTDDIITHIVVISFLCPPMSLFFLVSLEVKNGNVS